MIKKILHFLARLLLILLLMTLVLGGILLYNLQMNKSFITTFYTVTVDKPVEDLRIVLLSDLHLSEYGTDNADLVQKVRNLAPDLIAVAGLVLSLMRQLVDIAPVYYAPGNHEWAARYANGCDTIFDDIKATGVHWMNGTYEDATINGKKLRIGGFFEWPRAQLERDISREVADALNDETNALDNVCTILICHCPEVLDTSLADEKFDLVLSGHAHGGQVRIGGHGLWSTSQGFLPKYSRGLGDSEPYPRIFNQPELVVVDVN